MTRIKVFKSQDIFFKLMIGFGILSLLVGFFTLVQFFESESATDSSSLDWTGFLQGLQGLLFIGWGVYNLRNKKYFIEWDEHHLRFFLPDTKQPVKIDFADIDTVNVKLFEVELCLNNKKLTVDLNTLKDEDLKKVKSKFQSLKILKGEYL